jgi:hypothetical protein
MNIFDYNQAGSEVRALVERMRIDGELGNPETLHRAAIDFAEKVTASKAAFAIAFEGLAMAVVAVTVSAREAGGDLDADAFEKCFRRVCDLTRPNMERIAREMRGRDCGHR